MGQSSTATLTAKPPLNMTVRLQLSVMMFLQFAIWGSWFAILGKYLKNVNGDAFTNAWIGDIYGTMALGTIIAPLFVGQIADRFFASERLMAVLHVAGAGLLYWMGEISDPKTFYVVALVYALLYSPTLALSNSIAFAHVPDGNRDFPGLRVLGTVGWIAANWIVAAMLMVKTATDTPAMPNAPFLLGAGFSLILGLFSLALPHTPPPGKAGDALPFLKALGLFKDSSFAVFFGVSFVITIVLAFYYGFIPVFLENGVNLDNEIVRTVRESLRDMLGIDLDVVGPLLTIGQFAELLLLPFLPWFLNRFGMKWVLALGMLSWGLRYGLFSIYARERLDSLFPLILLGIALHGVCFDFFFAAGFIHVDNKAPADIRGSGQALFTFLTYGVGMWIGNMVSGRLADYLTNPTTKAVDWTAFWAIPAVGVLICFAVFVVFFRDAKKSIERL
jgi:nucleoside transporter